MELGWKSGWGFPKVYKFEFRRLQLYFGYFRNTFLFYRLQYFEFRKFLEFLRKTRWGYFNVTAELIVFSNYIKLK